MIPVAIPNIMHSYCFCREVSRDRERDKKRDQEDEEEAYERRKLERKLRDKEAAYQEVGNARKTTRLCQRSFATTYFLFFHCVSVITAHHKNETSTSTFILTRNKQDYRLIDL